MITQEEVNKLFKYNPKTGILTNRINRSPRGKAGFTVGSSDGRGYLNTTIHGNPYKIHRIIFLYVNGYLPDQVDHIDGDRGNNKIKNLRPATNKENQQNSKISKNNTSGYKGVSWCKVRKKYIAKIYQNGKNNNLGGFDDPEVAAQALRIERVSIHGEFCNHG